MVSLKKIIQSSVLGLTMLGLAKAAEIEPLPRLPIKKAVLFCADSYEDLGENVSLISLSSIYDSLKKMGYPVENIKVFYYDAQEGLKETSNHGKLQAMCKEQFDGRYDNKATLQNLKQALQDLAQTTHEYDEVNVYMSGAGTLQGGIYIAVENKDFKPRRWTWDNMVKAYLNSRGKLIETIDDTCAEMERLGSQRIKINPETLEELIKDIRAREQIFVFDSSYSGKAGQVLGTNKRVVFTSSSPDSICLEGRNESFGRFFYGAMANPYSDNNADGKITLKEAFDAVDGESGMHDWVADILGFSLERRMGFYGQAYNLEGNNRVVFMLYEYSPGEEK